MITMNFFNDTKANLALMSAVTLWSFSFVAIRIGLESYEPGSLGLLRFSVASFCLLTFLPKNAKNLRLALRDLMLLAGLGVIGIAGYSIFLNSGQRTVSSGLASFVVAQTPVITATLALLMLRERPKISTITGIGISVLGVTIIWRGQPTQLDFDMGLLLLLLAALCGSLHSIWQKHVLAGLSPYQVTAISTWFATCALLIFLPGLVRDINNASLEASMAVVFLGVIPSTLGQLLWCYGLRRTLVIKAAVYLYAMPFLSTIFAWIILGEAPGASALMGGSIALLGAIIVKKA